MAGTPRFKVYNHGNQYVAACKHLEDAACLVALYGAGATIRDGHSKSDIRWEEGKELFPAGESYDRVQQVVNDRIRARNIAHYTKQYGDLNNWPEYAQKWFMDVDNAG